MSRIVKLGGATASSLAAVSGSAAGTKRKRAEGENLRVQFPAPVVLSLCNQVDQICPLCGCPLFSIKRGRRFREFEIAHIYPLHPKPSELDLLKDEPRLSSDPNHDKNLIPLCMGCHSDYDTPKTLAGYRRLLEIKSGLIADDERRQTLHAFQIEQEIALVISEISASDAYFGAELSYDAKAIDSKLNETITPLIKVRIKSDVQAFYQFIRERFADIERASPGKAVLIATQVKAFYLKRRLEVASQQQIYNDVIDWILVKAGSKSRHAAEAIAAFFVQNCEIF